MSDLTAMTERSLRFLISIARLFRFPLTKACKS